MRVHFLLFFVIFSYPITSIGKIAVLILARGGSKGVRLKNLETVGGVSLLTRAIRNSQAAGIGDITVSTDHPLVALEALKSGASVFHRSWVTATDWAPSIWGAAEFLHCNSEVSILVLIQATSPLIRAAHIRDAVLKINHPIPFDCVFSVKRSYKLRWREINGLVSPVNFELNARPRRQDWNGELYETGAFYITRRQLVTEGYFQNTKIVGPTNCLIPEMSDTEIITIESLEETDVISVELVPERKGLILKHCEYYVSSRRHGTTVTRRYNEFVQLHDVLFAKYPYRAVCRLPPKRVVVGGGSPRFLQRRRAALQRWLTLVARHPVLAHDADLRTFLCETTVRLDKPKHDEFLLAGTQEESARGLSTEEMQASFVSEREQLRLVQLGLGRLFQIFERAESRCEAERADIRELGAGLSALSAPSAADTARWTHVRKALRTAAELVSEVAESSPDELDLTEDGAGGRALLALDALGAYRELCTRLSRGLHAERAAAAAAAPHSAASQALRARHRYALRTELHEARVARAYALGALESLPELFRAQGAAQALVAALWGDLHAALGQHDAKTATK